MVALLTEVVAMANVCVLSLRIKSNNVVWPWSGGLAVLDTGRIPSKGETAFHFYMSRQN